MITQSARGARWLKTYLRFVDYLGAAQLYLKDNCFLEEELKPEHFKPRALGHWGTVPGINLVYGALNYLAATRAAEILLVTGPGHGAPANLANLFLEGSLKDVYKQYSVDKKGASALIKAFSWPFTEFPSHVTPDVPGSILEGGELGYSLSTAFGAALDNPNLIVAAIVGDGEAESGPLAAAWFSNRFLNAKTSGAVLPIVHVNGFKISNPTLFGSMKDEELVTHFKALGYTPIVVSGNAVEGKMIRAVERAHDLIKKIQAGARKDGKVLKLKWPMIIMRTPKGWKGLTSFEGHPIAASFRSHGVPLGHPQKDADELAAVEAWLKSYKIHKLLDEKGKPKAAVMKFVPRGAKRLGANKHAVGGNMMKALKLPSLDKHELHCVDRGCKAQSSMEHAGAYLRDVFKKNAKNFRMFCPDEMLSNKLHKVFEVTKRAFVWPVDKNAELMDPEGRVMEMLSEHTLQGWMQGYVLTGRYGVFVSYEAFTTIIASMVDQFAKFIKQSFHVKWRKPLPPAVYIQSSVGWRQEHNGYSHQNPSFVSNVLQKHGDFSRVYYPADANAMLVALEEALSEPNMISVIVAGKRPLLQWQSLAEAREQSKCGMAVWEWATSKSDCAKPDVVLSSAGDYMTAEALMAIKVCKDLVPEMKIRYVNVSEVSSLCLGDYCNIHRPTKLSEKTFEKIFTKDKPVVFNYHGYVNDMEHILWGYTGSDRFSLHGYTEEGSTTTPFDMALRNKVSRYHLAIDMVEQAGKANKKIARKKRELCKVLTNKIRAHHAYIKKHGVDPPEILNMTWLSEM